MSELTFKMALFAIGLDAYWDQFEGLKEQLKNYLQEIERSLTQLHPAVVNAGLVDTEWK
ncbi:MAG TPA: hypothetical protein VM368_08885 [Flavisolibacter sp.]|nr:hypothetical protein [Flavisolibacter sp.]